MYQSVADQNPPYNSNFLLGNSVFPPNTNVPLPLFNKTIPQFQIISHFTILDTYIFYYTPRHSIYLSTYKNYTYKNLKTIYNFEQKSI
jgi:hypothetical protein